ncbi:hypothetical protein BaRGS_00023686, partial [Batillaria attramentaria]
VISRSHRSERFIFDEGDIWNAFFLLHLTDAGRGSGCLSVESVPCIGGSLGLKSMKRKTEGSASLWRNLPLLHRDSVAVRQ